jgi:hypothetical protein
LSTRSREAFPINFIPTISNKFQNHPFLAHSGCQVHRNKHLNMNEAQLVDNDVTNGPPGFVC